MRLCSRNCLLLETTTNESQHHDNQYNDPANDEFPANTALPNHHYPAAPISLPALLFASNLIGSLCVAVGVGGLGRNFF